MGHAPRAVERREDRGDGLFSHITHLCADTVTDFAGPSLEGQFWQNFYMGLTATFSDSCTDARIR
jgi:hypothetical protein